MINIKIVKKNILDMDVDAIVNAANSRLLAGGGVCGAIFEAAGYTQLQKACDEIGGCPTGSAAITPGFKLKQKYIIHAVGPIWNGGRSNEKELLMGAYKSSLKLAAENGCKRICFPLISAGIFGYPMKKAWEDAIGAVKEFEREFEEQNIDVYFAVLSYEIYQTGCDVLKNF